MTFQPNTIVFTRNGRKAEILAVLPPEKACDGQTVVALVDSGDYHSIETYFTDGLYEGHRTSTWDLMPTASVTVLAHHIKQVAE